MATALSSPRPQPEDAAAQRFAQLLETVRANRHNDDVQLIERAYEFCLVHHEGQTRASGEPFVMHPLEVAHVLAEMKLDAVAIAAGLLHDAVEDTPVTKEEIAERFGEQVAHIVEGVTKIDKIHLANAEDRQAENVRKMLLAMVTDIRVVLIKLADRLHNMRTLKHLPAERQVPIARETLEIYAPLAHRLGMGKLRGELEDLAFQYVDPVNYEKVRAGVEKRLGEGEAFLARVQQLMKEKMAENEIDARLEWRIKRLYSIQQKLIAQKITVDQVYDLMALRVVVKTVQDCYAVFGLIHSLWRPVPGRVKDFIAMPRPNLYQSLHTTVMAEGGYQFEVQIRTDDMHRTAEEGIAAHWKYKSGGGVNTRDEQRLAWMRQLVEWQREMRDPADFLSTLKVDLYPDEVYAFTPKGKVVPLPRDASPVDFAYAVHTEVGHACTGAKVNGRMVPLRSRLRNGDVVEVVTQKGHTPSRDWLTFVKSSRARNKIRHWLNENQRTASTELGRQLLEREARKYKVTLGKLTAAEYLRAAQELGMGVEQEMMSALGYGRVSAREVLSKLMPGVTTTQEPIDVDERGIVDTVKRVIFGSDTHSLKIAGGDQLMVYRARCCSPIPGEPIVGYVTRGKGVAVHAKTCRNVQSLMYEAERRIAVEWDAAGSKTAGVHPRYLVKLMVYCDDRAGMLKEMTAVISDEGTNIRRVDSKSAPSGGEAVVEFTLEAEDVRQLRRLLTGLRKVKGVRDVQRANRL
jgi:GTP diphosphokinase / guanosine-3',5'-bis(diphosphate) 3'-diphosphatase